MTDNKHSPSEDTLIMKWRGENIVEIDRDFLDMAGAKRKMDMIKIGVKKDLALSGSRDSHLHTQDNDDMVKMFLDNLKRKDVASQK